MPPQRLPIVNSDDGTWGDILRQYLQKEHYDDGTNNAANGGHKTITIRAGTAAANTAPLKFTSGTLLTTPEAGAVEFNTDKLYFTKTTGSTRQTVATYDTTGATGDIYYRDSGSNFVRLPIGSTGNVLRVSGGLPIWGGVPLTSLTSDTTTALGVGSINLGHASDTTITRVSAGRIAVEGVNVPTISSADILTNKTLTSPVISSISNTGTLTLPTATDTLVGRATTDTLTNKTMSGSSNTFSNIPQSAVTNLTADLAGKANTSHTHTATDISDSTSVGRSVLTAADAAAARTAIGAGTGSGDVTLAGTQTLTNKTIVLPQLDSIYAGSLTNTNYIMTDLAGQYPAFSPVPKYLWHDLLRFSRFFNTPTYETYSGSWSAQTLNTMLFNGKERQAVQVADGTTVTAARWTWNASNIAWSNISWWIIGFTHDAGGQTNNVVVESSSNGTDWTTRHDSITTASARPAWFFQSGHSGDTYLRLTITSTSGKVIELSSIRALSTRWGDQGGGSEYEYPYEWDDDRNITIGAGGPRSDGALNLGSTTTTTAAGGVYFGDDTNLYRSAANTLRTDDTLIVGTAGTAAGSVATIDGAQTLTNKSLTSPFVTNAIDFNDGVGTKLLLHGSNSYAIGVESSELRMSMSSGASFKLYAGGYTGGSEVASITYTGLLSTLGEIRAGASGTQADSVVTNAGAQTLTNKIIDASNNTLTNVAVTNIAAGTLVTESEGIASNDNDTTLPTSAAVKDYADAQVANKQARFMTGTISTASATAAKTVTLDSPWASTAPAAGDFFLLTYTLGSAVSSSTISINGNTARAVRTTSGQTSSGHISVEANAAVLFHFDGTYMRTIGVPTNSTYSTISQAEIINTASTSARLITGQRAEDLMVNEATVARTLTNKVIDAASNTITNLDVADFATSAIVTEAEGLNSSDNDTSLPTVAAVKDYVDSSGVVGWSQVTGTSQAAAINNGYITNNAARVTVTLPSSAAIGNIVQIVGKGAGGWRVAQNAGQTIHFGNMDTTGGTGGRLDSTSRYDTLQLMCVTANTDWVVVTSVGNIEVV